MPTTARKHAADKLSGSDRRAQKNLRRIWNDRARKLGYTQDRFAERWGISQGLISQYLNGHTAIGVKALLRFSVGLGVRPEEIKPDWEFATESGEYDPETLRILEKIRALSRSSRASIEIQADHLLDLERQREHRRNARSQDEQLDD